MMSLLYYMHQITTLESSMAIKWGADLPVKQGLGQLDACVNGMKN